MYWVSWDYQYVFLKTCIVLCVLLYVQYLNINVYNPAYIIKFCNVSNLDLKKQCFFFFFMKCAFQW